MTITSEQFIKMTKEIVREEIIIFEKNITKQFDNILSAINKIKI